MALVGDEMGPFPGLIKLSRKIPGSACFLPESSSDKLSCKNI